MASPASSASRIASSSSTISTAIIRNKDFRWAVGGWVFFILENAVLSENRTALIDYFGDSTYHSLYGLCSTMATGSIAYSYYHLKTNNVSTITSTSSSTAVVRAALSAPRLVASWTCLCVGLSVASQALPKMQIPVDSKLQVRCPFDFSDRRSDSEAAVHGLERITRHPGLWSLAFISAGQAMIASPPLAWWWCGPTAVAWLGGWHTDSRFRRGLGGTLDPNYDSQTSNVPFVAMLSGKQGNVSQAVQELLHDIKPLNAGMAVAIGTMWVVSKGRVRR